MLIDTVAMQFDNASIQAVAVAGQMKASKYCNRITVHCGSHSQSQGKIIALHRRSSP